LLRVGEYDRLANLIDDDCLLWFGALELSGRANILNFLRTVKSGIPDWSFQMEYGHEFLPAGATGTHRFTGTHTELLDLSQWGLGRHEPTGKGFTMARGRARIIVDGEKLTLLAIEGPGIQGVLRSLGLPFDEEQ
jgi:hypothetical protein